MLPPPPQGGEDGYVGEESSNASIRTNLYQMKDCIMISNFELHLFYRDLDFEIKMQSLTTPESTNDISIKIVQGGP